MSAPPPGRRAARRARMTRPRPGRTPLLLGVVALMLLLAAAADLALGVPTAAEPEPVAQGAASAGTWYCPAVAGESETATVTITAVGDEPATVTVVRYARGQAVLGDPETIEPGDESEVELTGGPGTRPTAVRWQGGPVVVSYRIDGARTTSAPCEPSVSETWHVSGFDTTLGSLARLHVFNPFASDAVVRLVFATPDGPVRLVLTDNLSVPAAATTTFDLARFQPEVADLGVRVEVVVGRVVAQGEQRFGAPGQRRNNGRVLLPAAPQPSESWAFGFATSGDTTSSYLAVQNPGDRPAAVTFGVSSAADGGEQVGETSVPAGGVARIELAEVSTEEAFGVSVSVVNGQPVVVTRVSTFGVGTPDRGTTASLGAAEPSREWALVGGGTGDRRGAVSVYNPGPETATVDVAAAGAPPEWSQIAVGPNERVDLALTDAGEDQPSLPVVVRSDVPVVAEQRSRAPGDLLRVWSAVGVPARAWQGPSARPPVRRAPGLGTRYVPPVLEPEDVGVEIEPLPAPTDGEPMEEPTGGEDAGDEETEGATRT